jgi:tetratricopeptide (TPR) repeat protein
MAVRKSSGDTVKRRTARPVRSHVLSHALGLVATVACAGARPPPAERPDQPALGAPSPAQQTVSRTIVTPDEAVTVAELLERAEQLLAREDPTAAAGAFDRVAEVDPDGPLAPRALLRASEAWEAAGDRDAAVARLERIARRYPRHAHAREALVRSVRLHAFMDRWARAGAAAQLLLTRYQDLRPIESVVAHGGMALSLVEAGDLTLALEHVERGRNVIDDHRLDAAGRVPRDLAQLYFALGEIRRLRADRIKFVPVPPDFLGRLEERCQLLLDAQSAYSDTMRAYDAHWSAMAGYRVGQLYQTLHRDLMAIPAPNSAGSTDRQQLFEGAMRMRYSVLLKKSLAMVEHTLAMAERTGERSRWVEQARDAKGRIERGIQAEQAALDRLPYTKDQLWEALNRLAKDRAASRGRPPPEGDKR